MEVLGLAGPVEALFDPVAHTGLIVEDANDGGGEDEELGDEDKDKDKDEDEDEGDEKEDEELFWSCAWPGFAWAHSL